jgi:hypothetical protein
MSDVTDSYKNFSSRSHFARHKTAVIWTQHASQNGLEVPAQTRSITFSDEAVSAISRWPLQLQFSYSLANIIKMIKSKRMG